MFVASSLGKRLFLLIIPFNVTDRQTDRQTDSQPAHGMHPAAGPFFLLKATHNIPFLCLLCVMTQALGTPASNPHVATEPG
jgi:hypothetical protein